MKGLNPVYFSVGVRIESSYCGWGGYFIRNGLVMPGTGALTIAMTPNPSKGETLLSIEPISEEKYLDDTAEWSLEVYSETQAVMERQTGLKGREYKIQTAGWKEGIYIVRVKYLNEFLTAKLVVKR